MSQKVEEGILSRFLSNGSGGILEDEVGEEKVATSQMDGVGVRGESPIELKPVFNWSDYLRQTSSVAAPKEAFFQNSEIPENQFEEDWKLELPDSRGPGNVCLGTIQCTHELWISVRLDGCDANNDRWYMCDEENLHPIGYAARTQGTLQPPVGFKFNIAKWNSFLDDQLNKGTVAPEDCFRPIPEKFRPKKNLFIEGQKLEAVDLTNFLGCLHPATIVKVDGGDLEINFDGWSSGFNMRCRYDSRNLFPIGYGEKSGIEVQPPSKLKCDRRRGRGGKSRGGAVNTPSHTDSPALSIPTPTPPESVVGRKSATGGDRVVRKAKRQQTTESEEKQKRDDGLKTAEESLKSRPGKGAAKESEEDQRKSDIADKIIASVCSETAASNSGNNSNMTAQLPARARKSIACPPRIAPKMEPSTVSASSFIFPNSSQTDDRVVNTDQQPTGTLGTRGFDLSSDVILTTPDKNLQTRLVMTLHINKGCTCGPWLSSQKIKNCCPSKIGPANANHVIRECVQQMLNCSTDCWRVYYNVEAGTSHMVVTADIDGRTHVRHIPSFVNCHMAWEYLSCFMERVGACRGLVSTTRDPCPQCRPEESEFRTEEGQRKKRKRRRSDSSESSTRTESGFGNVPHNNREWNRIQPENWSIDDVANFLSGLGDPSLPEKFRQHAIDGRAMMLLSPELLIKHMDLRLGPALKVIGNIDKLRQSATEKD